MTAATDSLTLEIGPQTFAVDAVMVREILDLVPVTEVPGARSFVGGVINVRGRIVPLADLRLRFGLPQVTATADTRIIVLELPLAGEPTTVGILADRVNEVTQLDQATVSGTPRLGLQCPPEFINGIVMHGGRLVVLPNLEQLLS